MFINLHDTHLSIDEAMFQIYSYYWHNLYREFKEFLHNIKRKFSTFLSYNMNKIIFNSCMYVLFFIRNIHVYFSIKSLYIKTITFSNPQIQV